MSGLPEDTDPTFAIVDTFVWTQSWLQYDTVEPVRHMGRKTYLNAGMLYATVLQIVPLSTLLRQEDWNIACF